ncbi:MAG: tyrosine-protein phosphatase [Rhizobiaceae bacterium]
MTTTLERYIRLEGAFNVRDLGGYTIGTGGATRWRSILRADGLHGLTRGDVERLLQMGLKTVVDLRSPFELDRQPSPFRNHEAVSYTHVPLFSELAPVDMLTSGGGTFDLAARYIDAADRCRPAMGRVLAAVADADEGVVLFNCSAGKDRTGLVAAMLLSLAGVGHEEIVEDYALTGSVATPLLDRLRQQAVARGLADDVAARLLSCEPATIRALLSHVDERYGGFRTYFDDAVAAEHMRRVAERLT